MIKIIIPQNNTNLMNDLSEDVLKNVVFCIFNTTDYEREFENRRFGRFIKIINTITNEIHFVCFSKSDNDSRNAHLMQFVSPAYIQFYNFNSNNKHIDIYLINPNRNDRTDYIKMFYRCFLTIGINILNLNELGISGIIPFKNYEDLKKYRNNTSERNIHNKQTYFTDDNEQISLYGKTFGANVMESFIFALTLKSIVKKPVLFYPVLDNNSDSIPQDQRQILEDKGIIFGDTIELQENGYSKPVSRITSRNTPNFHYNLLQKFGEKRCYLCGCDIEHLIIGSHIERVADIDRNSEYTEQIKAERATDGDNGLWLCANHDKMFEFGVIYFENELLRISNFVQDEFSQNFINKSIFETIIIYPNNLDSVGIINDGTFKIKNNHFNSNMREYIHKHINRIA